MAEPKKRYFIKSIIGGEDSVGKALEKNLMRLSSIGLKWDKSLIRNMKGLGVTETNDDTFQSYGLNNYAQQFEEKYNKINSIVGENDFIAFYNWAIENGYKNCLTIERINNDGNYSPSNCRWATREEQANNTSRNHFIVFNGEKHTMADWAKKLDIDYKRLENRINSGLSIEKCFYKGKLSNNGKDFL